MIPITFTIKNKDIIKTQIEEYIKNNIEEEKIINYKPIYKNNLQYFLINELLNKNKNNLALNVIEKINKELNNIKLKINQKWFPKNNLLKKDDIYYLHLFLVYKNLNKNQALDSLKLIKDNKIKEYCLFILNKNIKQLKEEIFNLNYNKYIIDLFINQFKDKYLLINFLNLNLKINWLKNLSLENKMDFYFKTKHIYLSYLFLKNGFINKIDSLTFYYKNDKLKEKIKNILNKQLINNNELLFPNKFCQKSLGINISTLLFNESLILKDNEIFIMNEVVEKERNKYINRYIKPKKIKLD